MNILYILIIIAAIITMVWITINVVYVVKYIIAAGKEAIDSIASKFSRY